MSMKHMFNIGDTLGLKGRKHSRWIIESIDFKRKKYNVRCIFDSHGKQLSPGTPDVASFDNKDIYLIKARTFEF